MTRNSQPSWMIAVDGVALGLIHFVLIASGGMLEGLSGKASALSLLTYVGWFLALRSTVELVAGFTGRRRLASSLFRIGWALSWALFIAQTVMGGTPTFELLRIGFLPLLVGVLGLASLVRGGFAQQSPMRGAAFVTLIVGAALALLAPQLVPSPAQDDSDLEDHRLDGLRTAASSVFALQDWNVLLITVDTLRADHLSSYGYERLTSPVVDSLAAKGMLFENVVATRPKTSPSFASILTGVYPARHGIHGTQMVLPEQLTTLAERLKASGFATGAAITNGNLHRGFGFNQGYDFYDTSMSFADKVTDSGLKWLNANATESNRWHFWAHYTDPHHPYEPPEEYELRFAEEGATSATQVQRYDAEIYFTDLQIGRLLEWLHARPAIRERTLIMFTADHGESLGEHDYWYEHGLHSYEASSRIPLIVVAPAVIAEASRSKALISAVDFVPTLLDAIDAPASDGIDGSSFLPLLAGLTDEGPRNYAYIEAGYGSHNGPGHTRAIRRESTKTIDRLTDWARWPGTPYDLIWAIDSRLERGTRGPEYYDLAADPNESEDLADHQGGRVAEELARLRAIEPNCAVQDFTGEIVEEAEIDEESLRSLKALGYIE